jgi:predicted nuclease of predicted toxin-antitoxin system
MKLLFDQNLSPRLVTALADVFPNASHVLTHNLGRSPDNDLWEFACLHDFMIVSKDSDFVDRAALDGPPPKIISLTLGNCSTGQVESLLRMRRQAIFAFAADPIEAVLFLP